MDALGRDRKPWTQRENYIVKSMRSEGATWDDIGFVLNRKGKTIQSHYNYVGKHNRKDLGIEYVSKVTVPPSVVTEQQHRNGFRHTDITALVCGDPLPGYSALDRMNERLRASPTSIRQQSISQYTRTRQDPYSALSTMDNGSWLGNRQAATGAGEDHGAGQSSLRD